MQDTVREGARGSVSAGSGTAGAVLSTVLKPGPDAATPLHSAGWADSRSCLNRGSAVWWCQSEEAPGTERNWVKAFPEVKELFKQYVKPCSVTSALPALARCQGNTSHPSPV